MHEATITLKCKNPILVEKSLEPDIKNDKHSTTILKAKNDRIEIRIKSKKINHLKAIINSYIDLVNMLIEVDKTCQS